MEVAPAHAASVPPGREGGPDPLRAAAARVEASFLSKMLKAARIGDPPKSFGGGIGEEQFASLLRDQIATQMSVAGGLGLAETVFNALKAADDARG